MRSVRRAAVALLLAGATACGSTVQVSGTAGGGPLAVDGLGGTPLTPTTATGQTTDAGAVGAPGAVALPGAAGAGSAAGSGTGATVPATGTTDGGRPATAGSPLDIPEKGPGWDRGTVRIGIMTQQDVQAVAESFGIDSVDSGDQVADVKAVIAELNLKGGLFGRKLVPEIYDIASAGDPETQGQAACSHFTTDVRVVAVYAMALVGDTPSFRTCMQKASVPVLAGGGQAFDDQVFDELKGYYNLMPFPSWSRFAGPFVDRLLAQQFYTGWNTTSGAAGPAPVKTGFLCPDTPIGRRVGALVRRESARIGQPLANETYFSASGADASSYVLRFKTDGITHVLFCDLALFVFAQQAESQQYRPRYGVSTFNTPVLFLQGLVPDAQLAGAIGVGWAPTLDVDQQRDPTTGAPPAAAECRALAARHGVSYSSERRFAQGVLYDTCDILGLIVSAAQAAGSLEGQGIRTGIGIAGSRLRSALTFSSGLSPAVRANPASTRDLFFDGACSCFRYRGAVVPMR